VQRQIKVALGFSVLKDLRTWRGVKTYQMSYWDAQIWASALLHQVPIVLSEDFSSEGVIKGVRFVNPFIRDIAL